MYIQTMNSKGSIVIIADSHILGGSLGKSEEFFKMLDHLFKLHHDVVFLGDVFELWVALKGYEDELHLRFVKWCAEAKTTRGIGFIEGNHEYHVDSSRAGAFTWSSEDSIVFEDGLMLAHGDLLNTKDWRYRLMRALFKSGLAKFLLKIFAPVGPQIAERIRKALKGSNQEHRKGIPGPQLEAFATRCGRHGAKHVVIGHFHEKGRHLSATGVELDIVPSWRDAGLVGVYSRATGKLDFKKWNEVW